MLTGEGNLLPERSMHSDQSFPPEIELALAHTPAALRPKLTSAFALDQRLGRIVAATTEPMLGQMRLAWWRDMLGTAVADRPQGDAVLDAIGASWAGEEGALILMVNAWEILVVSDDLQSRQLFEFADGRGAFWGHSAGTVWALADAASRVSNDDERQALVAAGKEAASNEVTSKSDIRGLRVLHALAQRSLNNGGRPMMDGRGASLTAMRAALFGR